MFSSADTAFGNQRRNQFYGPKYFDTDMSLMKNFRVPRWESAKFSVGAQFFNLFNHPNFDQPVNDIANTGQFGTDYRDGEHTDQLFWARSSEETHLHGLSRSRPA